MVWPGHVVNHSYHTTIFQILREQLRVINLTIVNFEEIIVCEDFQVNTKHEKRNPSMLTGDGETMNFLTTMSSFLTKESNITVLAPND